MADGFVTPSRRGPGDGGGRDRHLGPAPEAPGRFYLGREFFNYLIIVCARAEGRCPKTLPGMGVRFSWIFDDPRSEEDLPYDSVPERFCQVRDEIEIGVKDWQENPEAELGRLRESRERDRRERLAGGRSSSRSGWPGAGAGSGTTSPQ
jgi:hypothetical protein